MKKTTTSQVALASQNDLRGAVAGAWEALISSACWPGFWRSARCLKATHRNWPVRHTRAMPINLVTAGGWGKTRGRLGFQSGKVELERPRVRSKATGKVLTAE